MEPKAYTDDEIRILYKAFKMFREDQGCHLCGSQQCGGTLEDFDTQITYGNFCGAFKEWCSKDSEEKEEPHLQLKRKNQYHCKLVQCPIVLTPPLNWKDLNDTAIHVLSVFLAGGITRCKDWQSEVIKCLSGTEIVICNPRRKTFDITDPSATQNQIKWEFRMLEMTDIFSMYFCAGESDQPICMYELGRNIVRMQQRFPYSWSDRIVISVEEGYSRSFDVCMQTKLATDDKIVVNRNATPETHAKAIKSAVSNFYGLEKEKFFL